MRNAITEAVQQDFDWSRNLTNALVNQEEFATDLWDALLWGWSYSELAEGQWAEILSTLERNNLAEHHTHAIAKLLEEGARQSKIPKALFNEADQVADRVWQHLNEYHPSMGLDALNEAINHPGGKLTLFWLQTLAQTCQGTGCPDSLPPPFRDRLERVITEDSEAARLGQVVLASQLGSLYNLEESWTRDWVLPLLDWETDPHRAQQAWEGWLAWGQWSDPLLEELLPFYRQAFSKRPKQSEEQRRRLAEHVTHISLFGLNDPMVDDWLPAFLKAASEADREHFTQTIWHRLAHVLDADAKTEQWNRWLKRYWKDRNQGVPIPLADGELGRMLEWSAELGSVFPEAVETIRKGPWPSTDQSMLFRYLEERELAKQQPEALANLLVWLTSNSQIPNYHCPELEELTEALITRSASKESLRQLCENLARMTCSRAQELHQRISSG